VIDTYTHDLINKIKTVAAFGGRVAATLGGTEADPTLAEVTTPCAWVLFESSQNSDQANRKWQMMRLNFSVVLILPYGAGETDFIDTQLKLVEDTAQAVRGTLAANQGSHLWGFEGCTLEQAEPTRITYRLMFSADESYANQTT
jgi:hypothetical protein